VLACARVKVTKAFGLTNPKTTVTVARYRYRYGAQASRTPVMLIGSTYKTY